MMDQDSTILQVAGVTLPDDAVSSGPVAVLSPPSPWRESTIPPESGQNDEYLELRRLVRQAGLLERQPLYYTVKVLIGVALLGIGLTVMALVDTWWVQLINAVFVGFTFSQVAFIGHDAGHYQIARSARRNEMFGLLATFLVTVENGRLIAQEPLP